MIFLIGVKIFLTYFIINKNKILSLQIILLRMKEPQYLLSRDEQSFFYEFISEGPNGNVEKIITFTKISGREEFYNLAFGDKITYNNGELDIDDLVVTNNSDMKKVLATVFGATHHFVSTYSQNNVFFQGSTASRTRLYGMAIAKHYEELSNIFDIFGLNGKDFVPYVMNERYEGYLVRKR